MILVPIQTAEMVEDFNNYRDIFFKNKNVQSISRASSYPGKNSGIEAYVLEGREEKFLIREINVDFDFFKTLDIELVEGRVFEREKESDSLNYFIINQAAMHELNIEDPIGKRLGETINTEGDIGYGMIIGVVKIFIWKALIKL